MDNITLKRETIQQFMQQNAKVRIDSAITVSDVMTAEPECLSVHATALDLVKRFHATGFRHMLLADEQNRLVGIVSDRDVIRCFGINGGTSSEELQQIPALDLMSSDLITVESHTPLAAVVSLLIDHGISSVPVVDFDLDARVDFDLDESVAGGRLVGILTSTDLFLVLQSLLATDRTRSDLAQMATALA